MKMGMLLQVSIKALVVIREYMTERNNIVK